MARLPRLGSSLGTLTPSLPTMPRDEAARSRWRRAHQPWQQWYRTARWQRLRMEVLTRDLFTCQRCRRIEADTSQLVCDHVEPHRGDSDKFWTGPFQTLCKPCHDREKQREEANGWGRVETSKGPGF